MKTTELKPDASLIRLAKKILDQHDIILKANFDLIRLISSPRFIVNQEFEIETTGQHEIYQMKDK